MPQPNSRRRHEPADSRALMAALPLAAALICPAPAAAQDTDKDSSADKDVTLSTVAVKNKAHAATLALWRLPTTKVRNWKRDKRIRPLFLSHYPKYKSQRPTLTRYRNTS
ncbi:hypothetical protein DDY07_10850 [Methylomonas sp. ZR1]|nr:hypothetical protein [Methylomonas sp. ZR1]